MEHGAASFLLSFGLILLLSKVFSESLRKFAIPSVIAELLLGIMLGPTLLGNLWPEGKMLLFPSEGPVADSYESFTQIAVILLLFVAGMDVQLPAFIRQGRPTILTGLFSFIVSWLLGFVLFYFFDPLGIGSSGDSYFAFFIGTAMAISAIPVIARVLLDYGLFKTDVGNIIMGAAMFADLVGWLFFSILLAWVGKDPGWYTFLITFSGVLFFGLIMLTIGKRLIDRLFGWLQRTIRGAGSVISIMAGFCFLGAAFTEKLGFHGILGSFIVGMAVGDSVHLKEEAREVVQQFVTHILSPIFFVGIGLMVDFWHDLDLYYAFVILLIAFAGKIIGSYTGARIGGISHRKSLAVSFGLNARGAMEIILSSIALRAGIINTQIFVALVIMAFITSLVSGPVMLWLLSPGKRRPEA